jgi:hypothetical protein
MTWDRKIDYNTAYEYYTAQRDYEKKEYFKKGKERYAKRYTYYSILLIQLLNKCNVSEAIEALYMACNGKQTIVRKRKSKKMISIKMPKFDAKICRKHIELPYNDGNVKTPLISTWTKKNIGCNTHSNKHAR